MKNLEILYRLTAIAANIEGYKSPSALLTPDGWAKIIELWDELFEEGSEGIFKEAAHRIMWGIPRKYCKCSCNEVVDLVMQEMLSDSDAFKAWSSLEVFEDAVATVGSEMDPYDDDVYRHSIRHYEYLEDKLLYKVFYSKADYAEHSNYYRERISAYESAIKKIVPAAREWEEDYWCNENHILDEIERLYGIEYRILDYIEYDRFLLMLIHSSPNTEEEAMNEAWYASNITALPMKLARAIWREYTEERMLLMFLASAEEAERQAHKPRKTANQETDCIHPVGVFNFRSIYDSWLYPHIARWNQDPAQFSPLIQERLFTIAMNS